MTPYILLNPDDTHRPGDEMLDWVRENWIPLPAIHCGDQVGVDSVPCRRAIEPDDIKRLRAEINKTKSP